MPTARRGHALQDMPTQSCGHATRQIAMDGPLQVLNELSRPPVGQPLECWHER
jgi:hypothetical protein